MPTVTFAAGQDSFFEGVFFNFGRMALHADVVSQSPTVSVFEEDWSFDPETHENIDTTYTYTLNFTDNGATIDSWSVEKNGEDYFQITDFNLSVATYTDAIDTEIADTDTRALEILLYSQDWVYFGNDNDELFYGYFYPEGDESNLDGNNSFYLNDGADQFILGDGIDYVEAGDGDDSIAGGAGKDTLKGGDGDDYLAGEEGADIIIGGAGEDYLLGGRGNDTLIGGDELDDPYDMDWDIVVYKFENQEGGTQGIKLDLAAGIAIDTFGNTDILSGIEEVWGSIFDDTMLGSAEQETLLGYKGKDVIKGKGGDDHLDGGKGADIIKGGKGGDNLFGGYGKDLIEGGKGRDYLVGSRGDDVIDGGRGYDTVSYHSNSGLGLQGIVIDMAAGTVIDTFGNTDTLINVELIEGSTHADIMIGGAGDDEFVGNEGNDRLEGKKGGDELTGGDGDDELYGGKGGDALSGGDGADFLAGGKGEDSLLGGDGDDILFGGNGNDYLNGGDGNDTINAGAGDDLIFGGDDDDIINGGAGNDTIYSGTGADTLIIGIGGGNDIVEDFDLALDVLEFEDETNLIYTQQGDDVLASNGNESALLVGHNVDDFL